MKVSVIIAAYNAEKYLEETLDSVTHQTLDAYEIIVVNDGSTDRTGEILENYRAEYKSLKVIHKENGGPSSARNAGLEIAEGEFVFFFDSDDILVPDALEELYNRAVEQKADLVIASYDIFDRYKTFPVHNINNLIKMDTIEKYDLMILWTFSLCNKLFRKSLIDQFHFRFPPVSYSEDGAFVMEYVYHARKITGLDMVVFHYRRMFDGEATSITASVSPAKIKDYIAAHSMILESAQASILRDYPQYATIDEARSRDLEIHKYLCEIIRKELQVLLGQFYAKFWSLEENVVKMLVDEIKQRLSWLDMRSLSLLSDAHPELSLYQIATKKEEALRHAYFTAVLYGEPENPGGFLNTLKSLTLQNLVNIKIWVPLSMKTSIEEADLLQGNIAFISAETKDELQEYALKNTDTPYIVFCDSETAYANNAFKWAFKRFIKSSADFIGELIYHGNYGEPQPVYLNSIAVNSLREGTEYAPQMCMDHTLANKFFRTEFLRRYVDFAKGSILDQLEALYRRAYFLYYSDGIVIYENTENSFLDYISTPETREYIENYFDVPEVSLNGEAFQIETGEALPKLQALPARSYRQRLVRKAVHIFKKLPLKNQVLFLTVRRDGELEGNTKALYPYVKSPKKVCAKQLPHGYFTSIKMFYHVITSKVIVTDDYLKYLRHFPLKKEQRVIQLWHACGAFKKFGRRGTNISVGTDMATHAQYNLVSVSGDFIRPIYADAFNINVKKVQALGCPRTDDFFDQKLMEEKRERIYQKYPDWKDKYVIIYAPTFRDVGKDRTQFHPELDFDRLSGELLPNQLFLVCPHPIMKNDILEKEYDNIKLIREFSTNDLMFVSDLLVTDYSSVIFEYVLLKKPIAFFCYDLVTYNRGFYLNYPDDLPGNVYENQKALTDYLRDPGRHVTDEKYNIFIQKYMSGCDGHSCERIAKIINDYMEAE